MQYPFLFLFLSLVLGILFHYNFQIYVPFYIPILLFLITFLLKNRLKLVSFLISFFVLGIFISQKEIKPIKTENPVFIQCKVISFPKIYSHYESFNCKVSNSSNNLLKTQIIHVYNYEINREIQFLSSIYFIGKIKKTNNNLIAIPTENFLKIDNSFNFLYPIFRLKNSLLDSYKENSLNPELFSLGSALIFGEKGYLSNSLREKFSHTGLSHLLAISGLHIGILITSIFLFLFFLRDRVKYYLIILILPFYTIFTGLQIPVLRASLMGELYFLSKIKYLKVNSLNILFFVGFIVLLFSPYSLFKLSFLLSFTATVGIILALDFIINIHISIKNESLSKILTLIFQTLLISFIATLFTLPIILYYFGGFSPTTIFATPIGILILYPYLFLSIFNLLTFMKIPILITAMDSIGYIFIKFVSLFDNLGFYFKGYNPSLLFIILFFIFISTILILRFNFYKKIAILISAFFFFLFISKTDTKSYKIYTFKSKNYPSVIIITPDRESYLFAQFPYFKFKTVLIKENTYINTLITSNRKTYIFSSQLDVDFQRTFRFFRYFKSQDFTLIKGKNKLYILIKNHRILLKNENNFMKIDG